MKLECKRADVDMETLRRTLEEERRKFKLEQEVCNSQCSLQLSSSVHKGSAYNTECHRLESRLRQLGELCVLCCILSLTF